MNIRKRITEVAVEVGRGIVVTGTIGVKESIATEVGAAVQVLVIVRGADMRMSGVVGAGHMEVPLLFGIAPSLAGAHLLGGAPLLGGAYLLA